MKTITINVSAPTYREFQEYARRHDRKTSELIREAMELYRVEKIEGRQTGSLAELEALSLGRILKPLDGEDDLLGEMTNL
jgi:predicted transcriptional regulator